MKHLHDYALSELKLVYRVLHGNLMSAPELLDAALLSDLQTTLQIAAQADGVDVSDHAAWDRWLGNPGGAPCAARVAQRRTLNN